MSYDLHRSTGFKSFHHFEKHLSIRPLRQLFASYIQSDIESRDVQIFKVLNRIVEY